MDIFFTDPSEVPLPPDEVRIRELNVEPWPDGKRLHVYFEVDPFQRRPNAELILLDQNGREVSSVSIIESMTRKMELVMHLRTAVTGPCTLRALLYYAALPQAAGLGSMPAGDATSEPKMERKVIDTRQLNFEIPV